MSADVPWCLVSPGAWLSTTRTLCHRMGRPVFCRTGFACSHPHPYLCPHPRPPAMQAPAPRCCSPGLSALRPLLSSSSSSLCSCSPTGSGRSGCAGGSLRWGHVLHPPQQGLLAQGATSPRAGCCRVGMGPPLGTTHSSSPLAGSRADSRRPWALTGTAAPALRGWHWAPLSWPWFPAGDGCVLAVLCTAQQCRAWPGVPSAQQTVMPQGNGSGCPVGVAILC